MRKDLLACRLSLFAFAFALGARAAHAEEGLWTYDALPLADMRAAYGFHPDQAWFDRVRLATPRLSSGCSSSVVSPSGLVATNQHCVAVCEQALSSAGQAFVDNGFFARNRNEERRCPGLRADILLGIADVTAKVRAAGPERAAIAKVEEQACRGRSDRHCEVVRLFNGAQFKLYTYKRYADVRLVFAPEYDIAQFGGDLDNFSFPRFSLDAALLRLYEKGKPADTPNHLVLDTRRPKDGEQVFIAGDPGQTQRSFTAGQAAFRRDILMPMMEGLLNEFRGRLIEAMASDPTKRETGRQALYDLENTLKVYRGMVGALRDPAYFSALIQRDHRLAERVAADPVVARQTGDPWADLDRAGAEHGPIFPAYSMLEQRAGYGSELFDLARRIVRSSRADSDPAAAEPDWLRDASPTIAWLERLRLEFWLAKTRELLTNDDPRVALLLGRNSPEAVAARLVADTRVGDPAFRLALFRDGRSAIAASDDPLIRLVLAMEPSASAVRREYEQKVAVPTRDAEARLARARFALDGDALYPDATGTPRISYGKVQGVSDGDRAIDPLTTIGGLFARARDAAPYRLPARWLAARQRLDPALAFNAATTADTAGGNSGSPVISVDGRAIGVMFDVNFAALASNYAYAGEKGRTIFVTGGAIDAALREVYDLPALADEIRSTARRGAQIRK